MTRNLLHYRAVDGHYYKIPVAEWTPSALMALDSMSRLHDEDKDPERTNSNGGLAQPRLGPAQNKPREFQVGGLKDSYASEPDPAEDDDLDDDDLPDEVIEALCAHAEESGFGKDMVRRLRSRLGGGQAQDDPPAFRGEPLRGGAMRAMDVKMAMDARKRLGSFASRNPDAARIGRSSTFKRTASRWMPSREPARRPASRRGSRTQ
jgi:hypothetical protein